MYLKKIVLQGFKSFADKTVIEVHQGVTAIVGPNGSGKSNISDAVRWVMGEQSAKTLRGGKMEDVIFAGTQKRKPLGYAEVSLILDNTTHFLPCDYDEVEITRRVFRSGESEYMINRTACRLKDINELLMDTGLGRDGYSIVGQGKIAEIVSSKGDDRRQIFEEAAGISKYRYRKNEAERKLNHTEDNLVRVRDILGELTERVEPLKRQSEKAIKFLDLREQLKGIEVSTLLEITDLKRRESEETGKIYDNAVREFEEAKVKLEEYNEKSDKLYAEIRESDTEIDGQRERLTKLENDGAGLNLTYEVRDGILHHTGEALASTLEGIIVKFADRIAYINHDIDDAIRAGILSIDDIPSELTDVLGKGHSERINRMVTSVITASTDSPVIMFTPEVGDATSKLRKFLFENVYTNSIAKSEDNKAQELLARLFEYYVKYPEQMPELYFKNTEIEPVERCVCDFVASMTDRFAINRYSELFIPQVWRGKQL